MKTIKILFTLLMFTFITTVAAQEYNEPNLIGNGINIPDTNGVNIIHTINKQINDNFTDLGINYMILLKKDDKVFVKNICTLNFIGQNIIIDEYVENDSIKTEMLMISTVYWTNYNYLVIKCVSTKSMFENEDGIKEYKNTYIILDLYSTYTIVHRNVCYDLREKDGICYSWKETLYTSIRLN